MDDKKIKFLVADTTAFINSVQLNEYAENILTVPDVVNEVKNKRQLRRLVVLPFDLQVQEPKPENVLFVSNFAKKTGDFASLSAIDLKVIALTYELEKEKTGTVNLRTEPVVSRIIASKDKPKEFIDNTKLAGFFNPSGHSVIHASGVDKTEDNDQTEELSDAAIDSDNLTTEELEKYLADLTVTTQQDSNIDNILKPSEKLETDLEEKEQDVEESSDEDSQDDDSWITPTNIQKIKTEFGGNIMEVIPVVACMSTDFAIQNVLKQINLNISALDGRIIKHLRTYILRCYSCFKTTSIMTKEFCPNCGNKTLKRVAVSLNENGEQVIHINSRRPLTAKFKNQSLPRPQGGKHSRNPILFEDQPIPKQMPSRVAKTKTNALDEDYATNFSPFVMRDVNSKSALLRSKGNIKEWARNNAFEEYRRKKNFNRFVK